MGQKSDPFLTRRVIREGDIVFNEGDPATGAFIVQEGQIEIFRRTGNDRDLALSTIGKGGIFGEMALIDDQPRMASARAAVMSTIIVVPKSVFAEKLARCDGLIRKLLTIFANNARSLSNSQVKTVSVDVPPDRPNDA